MNPTVLIGLRADHATHTPESEAVVVSLHAGRALLQLDDGSTLDLDAAELTAALHEQPTQLSRVA